MDSEETERLIEVQHWPQEIRPMLGSVEEHFNPSVEGWMNATASTRDNLLYMAKVLAGSLGGAAIGSQAVTSLSASGRAKDVVLRGEDLIKSSVMPNKSTRYGPGSRPGSETPQPTLIHKTSKGKPMGGYGFKMTNSVVPMKISSNLTHDSSFIDSSLLMTTGEARLTKIRMTLGKQVYPNVIEPFLKNLNGHAVLRMQFAGRMVSPINTRHTHMQFFRHRLSSGTTYNRESAATAPYPTNLLPNILDPDNSVPFVPAGGTATDGWPVNTTSFRDIKTTNDYWAPYNLADLEDCSWNLNALKLYPNDVTATQTPKFANNCQMLKTNAHFRQSFLAYNNSQNADPSTRPATYRYKAVLNKGSIAYMFMNKGTAGAKVDIIIYRCKKNNVNLPDISASVLSANLSYCNEAITTPIGAGYLNTVISKAGTDLLSGRVNSQADVFSNALYPLLKNYKLTKQQDLPFVEVSRQTFAMPSGSRRDVEIILPGLVYDPENIPGQGGSTPTDNYPSILNQYTYGVYIATSGVPCTQELLSGNSNYNVGDMISKADVQFYATYSEHIGACSYKEPAAVPMYCQGGLLDPLSATVAGASGGFVANPVVMLPQSTATRTPATLDSATSTGAGINLTADFGAEPV